MSSFITELLDAFTGRLVYRRQGRVLSFDAFSQQTRATGGTLIVWGNSHWWTSTNLVAAYPDLPWRRSAHPKYSNGNNYILTPARFTPALEEKYLSINRGAAKKVSLTKFESYGETECYDELLAEFPQLTVVQVEDASSLLPA